MIKKTWVLHIDILENGCFRAQANVVEPRQKKHLDLLIEGAGINCVSRNSHSLVEF